MSLQPPPTPEKKIIGDTGLCVNVVTPVQGMWLFQESEENDLIDWLFAV